MFLPLVLVTDFLLRCMGRIRSAAYYFRRGAFRHPPTHTVCALASVPTPGGVYKRCAYRPLALLFFIILFGVWFSCRCLAPGTFVHNAGRGMTIPSSCRFCFCAYVFSLFRSVPVRAGRSVQCHQVATWLLATFHAGACRTYLYRCGLRWRRAVPAARMQRPYSALLAYLRACGRTRIQWRDLPGSCQCRCSPHLCLLYPAVSSPSARLVSSFYPSVVLPPVTGVWFWFSFRSGYRYCFPGLLFFIVLCRWIFCLGCQLYASSLRLLRRVGWRCVLPTFCQRSFLLLPVVQRMPLVRWGLYTYAGR